MKRKVALLLILSLSLLLILPSCGGDVQRISTHEGEQIVVVDVIDMPVQEAVEVLNDAGFTNVSTNGVDVNDGNKWIVKNQSIEGGKTAYADQEIKLTCVKIVHLYIDVTSDANLLFNKYDMNLFLDGKELGYVSNGNTFTLLLEVEEGDHEFEAYKSGSTSVKASKTLSVLADTTFHCKIEHASSITFSDVSLSQGVEGAALIIPDVSYQVLSRAMSKLESIGFSNVREEPYSDIWNRDNWIVIKQNFEPGTELDKNVKIQLDCISLDDYFKQEYVNQNLETVQGMAAKSNIELKYKDESGQSLDEKIASEQSSKIQYWIVTAARQYGGSTATAVLTVAYGGSPEEIAAAKEQAERVDNLNKLLPQENAQKAIVVAFTNNSATDVFSEDGNEYDPGKFHGYQYSGEFKQTILDEGTWTAKDDTTWHVENMVLYLKDYDHATRLKCDITFVDGVYILSNVEYITAAKQYIDTEDPSKTSGWMTLEEEVLLNMPESIVTGDGGQNTVEREEEETAPTPSSNSNESSGSSGSTSFENWYSSYFSVWDGSCREFNKLIKKNLNDEKSFKHIETKFVAIDNQTKLDSVNQILADSGYADRCVMYDVLIITEFSAKNAFNATIKSTAIGVLSYTEQTIRIIDMG